MCCFGIVYADSPSPPQPVESLRSGILYPEHPQSPFRVFPKLGVHHPYIAVGMDNDHGRVYPISVVTVRNNAIVARIRFPLPTGEPCPPQAFTGVFNGRAALPKSGIFCVFLTWCPNHCRWDRHGRQCSPRKKGNAPPFVPNVSQAEP